MTTHIGPKGPSKCNASTGKCPYGGTSGLDNHFITHEDAVAYYDGVMSPLLGAGSLKKNQPNPLAETYSEKKPPALEAVSKFIESSKAIPGLKVSSVEGDLVTMNFARPGYRSFTLAGRTDGLDLKLTASVRYSKDDFKWSLKDAGYNLKDVDEYADDQNVEVTRLSKDEFEIGIKEFTLQRVETGESLAYKLSTTLKDLEQNGGFTNLSGKVKA